MNRLTRDELIHAALDMADLPSLNEHDRPGGVVLEGAYAVGWLQRGLDLFYHKWPFAATIKLLSWTLTPGVDTYNINASPINAATDFVKDVKDSLICQDSSTIQQGFRTGLDKLVEWKIAQVPGSNQKFIPKRYIITPPNLIVFPVPDLAYAASLYYYSLPVVLTDGTKIPTFPSDDVLVEYLRMKALEWGRQIDPGTAHKYANAVIGEIQASGQGREAESEAIPLDRKTFRPMSHWDPNQWMGKTTT